MSEPTAKPGQVPEEAVQEAAVQEMEQAEAALREAAQAEAELKKTEALSRKRRTALVAYLAILFAVAFLLVAVSMVLENKKLQNYNLELQSSNEQSRATSASAMQRAEALQNENQELIASLEALQPEKTDP